MKRFAAIAFVLAVCSCSRPAEEHYGFLPRLGNDTVSVERVTRTGNTLVSDEVDRFPRVRQTPSEPPAQRVRHVVAVHITKTDSSGTKKICARRAARTWL